MWWECAAACQEEGVCMPQIVSPSTEEVFLSEHLALFVIVYSAGFVCLFVNGFVTGLTELTVLR